LYSCGCSGSNTATTDHTPINPSESESEGCETAGDDEDAEWLKADSSIVAPPTELSESDRELQLSSIDVNPINEIFQWLQKYVVCNLFFVC